MKGQLISREDVLFSWALAEAYSPRWREMMRSALPAALKDKLDKGAADFSEEEKQALLGRLDEQRKDKIKGYITPFSIFRLEEVAPLALEALAVSPQVGGWDRIVTLGQFIDGKYSADTSHDPRNAAKRMLASPEKIPYTGYPIVSFSKKLGCPVLIEGYTRCIASVMRHRKGEHLPPLRMIFCRE